MKSRMILLMVICAAAVAMVTGRAIAGDDTAAERVAIKYGLESWGEIEELRYTFNVRSGDREVRRSWVWRVKDREVTYRDEVAGDEPVIYSQDDINDETPDDLKKVDHRFINDQYWLIFALHVAWDDATITEAPAQPLPIGEGTATRITVQYPETGGYTPGDAYDIFVGDDGLVSHWIFRQGGQAEPSLVSTWEDHKRVGPITVPTRFRSEDGKFELWFSGLAVKVSGSDGLMHVQ